MDPGFQPRPHGFSLKKWAAPHPFFKSKALGTRLPGFHQNTVRDSGNVNGIYGIRLLPSKRDSLKFVPLAVFPAYLSLSRPQ